MRFTIEVDDSLLPALRAIDPKVRVEDGDDEEGEFGPPGELVVVDAELQTLCVISKRQWTELAPSLARVVAAFLDQAATAVPPG